MRTGYVTESMVDDIIGPEANYATFIKILKGSGEPTSDDVDDIFEPLRRKTLIYRLAQLMSSTRRTCRQISLPDEFHPGRVEALLNRTISLPDESSPFPVDDFFPVDVLFALSEGQLRILFAAQANGTLKEELHKMVASIRPVLADVNAVLVSKLAEVRQMVARRGLCPEAVTEALRQTKLTADQQELLKEDTRAFMTEVVDAAVSLPLILAHLHASAQAYILEFNTAKPLNRLLWSDLLTFLCSIDLPHDAHLLPKPEHWVALDWSVNE
eukprot:6960024-Prymnesium_polylepis.1